MKELSKWAAVVVSILLSGFMLASSWGKADQRLASMEKRIEELLCETRQAREQLNDHERRIAYMEGFQEKPKQR